MHCIFHSWCLKLFSPKFIQVAQMFDVSFTYTITIIWPNSLANEMKITQNTLFAIPSYFAIICSCIWSNNCLQDTPIFTQFENCCLKIVNNRRLLFETSMHQSLLRSDQQLQIKYVLMNCIVIQFKNINSVSAKVLFDSTFHHGHGVYHLMITHQWLIKA